LVNGPATVFWHAHITRNEECLPAIAENFVSHLLAALLVAPGQSDTGAFFGKKDRGSLADTGRATGDQRNFISQVHDFDDSLWTNNGSKRYR